jgi:hypothetical protein
VLAEVMVAWALRRLDGVVGGVPREIPTVVVEDDEAAFVTRILPGCDAVLARG